ncbi:MAG: LysE family transporter [Verrucomicrobiota bacterium]|nr:LysE family transporter [Verrucomicrobiota bacterium]
MIESLVKAGVTGLISGFLVCIPVGPINVAIINEGARRGFIWGLMVGLGAMVMDLIYCLFAFAGFSSLFTTPGMRAAMELISFLLMLFLGLKYVLVRDLPSTTPTMEAVEQRFHPHTAFWIGFVRVLGNPAVLLFWITLSATFLSHGWIQDNWASKGTCAAGNFTGGMLWFAMLSYLVGRGRGRFSKRTLVMMSHISGASLLIAAMVIGVRLVNLIHTAELQNWLPRR